MTFDHGLLVRAALGLLPVLCFLGALLAFDSYKLVRPRVVLVVIALGCAAAGACYAISLLVAQHLAIDFATYSRWIAPWIEESAKGAVVVALIRAHRAGFLVDAAILGFATGAGFATFENLYYLSSLADANIASWLVRGFGTAILHGGVQAIFAVLVLDLSDRRGRVGVAAVLPALLAAAILHGAFNAFVLPPVQQTLAVMLIVPAILMWVFARSEKAVSHWVGEGFDADADTIALLDSREFPDSPPGRYLDTLRAHFRGETMADLLCYLRLHVELALRAKGLLMQRELGIETEIDEATREKFAEMRYLERAVGPTALRALKPLLHTSRRDLWQLYMLGK